MRKCWFAWCLPCCCNLILSICGEEVVKILDPILKGFETSTSNFSWNHIFDLFGYSLFYFLLWDISYGYKSNSFLSDKSKLCHNLIAKFYHRMFSNTKYAVCTLKKNETIMLMQRYVWRYEFWYKWCLLNQILLDNLLIR